MSLLRDMKDTFSELFAKVGLGKDKSSHLNPLMTSTTEDLESDYNFVQDKQPYYLSSSYDSGQGYRQLERVSRLMTIGFIITGCLVVCLCFAIYALCPLKQIQPYIMGSRDKQDQIVQVQPIIVNGDSWDIMVEHWCREFVINLETINGIEDEKRQQDTVFLFSSPAIWEEFKRIMHHNDDSSPLKQHKEKGATRSVKIDLVTKLRENQWRVEWISMTRDKDGEAHREKKVSTMEIEFEQEKIPAKYKFINPYGMVVTKYAVGYGREIS